jgi:hypothetical protein
MVQRSASWRRCPVSRSATATLRASSPLQMTSANAYGLMTYSAGWVLVAAGQHEAVLVEVLGAGEHIQQL